MNSLTLNLILLSVKLIHNDRMFINLLNLFEQNAGFWRSNKNLMLKGDELGDYFEPRLIF